ncbi:MAG: hypothetical protein GXO69_08645 [Acidobacteria bacterium]|nr:hypothetical protein [Acidobacteriota bacterium]
MKLKDFLKDNLLLILLTILIGGSGFYFLVLHPKFRITHAPKLLKAVVVVKTNKLNYATNERLLVTPGDDPVLQAVVIAKKQGDSEPTYFSVSKHLKIDGKMIPEDRIETWDTFKWKDVRILWFKIEPVVKPGKESQPFSYQNIQYKSQFQYNWPLQWTHALDVNGFANTYPRQNFGFMRFRIRAEIKKSIVNVVQKCYSPGPDDVDSDNIISSDVFGVQYAPAKTPFGYAVSLFNLAFVPSIDFSRYPGGKDPVSERIAVDSVSYFTEAMRMAGHSEIIQGNIDSLLKHIQIIIKGVHLDKKKEVYVDKKGNPVKTSRLKKGMFITDGKRIGMYAGEGSFAVGKLHVLTPDDRVLYAPSLPLYYEEFGSYFEGPFSIGEVR